MMSEPPPVAWPPLAEGDPVFEPWQPVLDALRLRSSLLAGPVLHPRAEDADPSRLHKTFPKGHEAMLSEDEHCLHVRAA